MPLALAFNDQQLRDILAAGHQLPPALHHVYLQRVAAKLDGREFSDADVWRTAHAVVRELLAEPRDQRRRPSQRPMSAAAGGS
jgi:hypothetical protein